MIYGSVCSGIEAATVAWKHLGWKCEFVSEIEPFPSTVLAHHYPNVPNLGDFTRIEDGKIDLLVGGTPCQSFSSAGKRKGLADERGNLALEFAKLSGGLQPKWVVWENVPGVLNSNKGRDFRAFTAALAELGYGFAYRVLDARHYGIPQRRRRVFLVGYLGDWRRAAAVLFEQGSLRGGTPEGEKKKKEVAGTIGASAARSRGAGIDPGRLDFEPETFIVSGPVTCVPYADSPAQESKLIAGKNTVRRLTPKECERLQGFPDDYTLVPYRRNLAADGPRYKAIGNSMAVPVMRWIGERIDMTNKLCEELAGGEG